MFEQTQEDSLTDPLTGLPNRRSMFVHLSRELRAPSASKSEVALIVMDIDGFKTINDTYGHHVGDNALREVAAALQGALRPYDLCVRYAGDEFIIVLADCSREAAEAKRRELQERSSAIELEVRPGKRLAARRERRRVGVPARRVDATKRCSPTPTSACTATRRRAAAQRSAPQRFGPAHFPTPPDELFDPPANAAALRQTSRSRLFVRHVARPRLELVGIRSCAERIGREPATRRVFRLRREASPAPSAGTSGRQLQGRRRQSSRSRCRPGARSDRAFLGCLSSQAFSRFSGFSRFS